MLLLLQEARAGARKSVTGAKETTGRTGSRNCRYDRIVGWGGRSGDSTLSRDAEGEVGAFGLWSSDHSAGPTRTGTEGPKSRSGTGFGGARLGAGFPPIRREGRGGSGGRVLAFAYERVRVGWIGSAVRGVDGDVHVDACVCRRRRRSQLGFKLSLSF